VTPSHTRAVAAPRDGEGLRLGVQGGWGLRPCSTFPPSSHLRVSEEKLLGAEALGQERQAFPSVPVELEEEGDRGRSPTRQPQAVAAQPGGTPDPNAGFGPTRVAPGPRPLTSFSSFSSSSM